MATIVTRAGKGTPLTFAEVDGNFTNLNTDKIENVVEDTTPQLGGNLDLNTNDITGTGNIDITGNITLTGTVDGRDVAADGSVIDGLGTISTQDADSVSLTGGTLSGVTETVASVTYALASQYDIGTAPNKIPLNQYLGTLAYQDGDNAIIGPISVTSSSVTISETTSLTGNTASVSAGVGITGGTGTVYKTSVMREGDVIITRIAIDLTGLNAGATAGDIIGTDGTGVAYIGQVTAAEQGTVFGVRMTCLEAPTGGDTDIDLYSATEATGEEDDAISGLTETQIINGGTQSLGTVTAGSTIAADQYLYLVGQGGGDATYTAGRLLIEIFGYA